MTLATENRQSDEAQPSDPATDQPSAPSEPNEEPSPTAPNGEPTPSSDAVARASDLDADIAALRDKLETAEKKRIPGLQAAIDKAQKERDRALGDAATHRAAMLEWTRQTMIRTGNEDEWREIERHEQERTGRVLETQAGRAETMEVINDLLDSDDTNERNFGRYLRSQVKAGTEGNVPVKVTAQNLGTYRQMYEAGRGAPAASPSPAPQAPTSAPARAAAPATPPRTLAPSGAPATNGEPAYKKGDTPRSLFERAFRLKDRTSEAE